MSILSQFKDAVRAVATPKKSAPIVPPAATEKKPADPLATVALLAWRAPEKNARLLIAYKPGTDPTNPNNLVSVNVRSNVNFRPHMKLRVTHSQGTTYDLVGPLPRWRGKW